MNCFKKFKLFRNFFKNSFFLLLNTESLCQSARSDTNYQSQSIMKGGVEYTTHKYFDFFRRFYI